MMLFNSLKTHSFIRLCVLLIAFGRHTVQYEFEMSYQTKCLMEELSKNVLVVLDYKAFHKDMPEELVTVSVTVGWCGLCECSRFAQATPTHVRTPQLEDPNGKLLHDRKHEPSGQFGFTTDMEGDYKACFMVKGKVDD